MHSEVESPAVWLGIDGTNWVHALYHSPGVRDVLGLFCRRVKLLAQHLSASAVLVCFDRRSFRHDLFAEYKANRGPRDDSLRLLLAEAEKRVGEVGQLVYDEGREADDCLATLAAIAVATGRQCVMASADKDLYQCLVSGAVRQVRKFASSASDKDGKQREADLEWQTAESLEVGKDTAGLRPGNWCDYQALVGQAGDNLAGCPGWGPVTARRELVKAGSLEALLRNRWLCGCSDSQWSKLVAWAKAEMGLALELVRLRTDVVAVREALR